MNTLVHEFEDSFNENWLPEEMLKLYAPIECVAENASCTTLVLQSRNGEEKCIAKCYNKDNIQISVTENEILSSVSHKGLPAYIGKFENDQTICVLRQYIEGTPLDRIIDDRKCTPDETVSFALKICEILNYLHKLPSPVLHRDIKPENIIVDDSGEVHLIDFGISRIVRDVEKRDTRIAATAAYAPPEQFGFLPTDARSDLYALGVVMNEMFTGSTELKDAVHGSELSRIIRKCTAFSPDDRYRSASHLAHDLKRWKHRYLWIVCAILATAAALALLAFGVAALIINNKNNESPIPQNSESFVSGSFEGETDDDADAKWTFDTGTGIITISGTGYLSEEIWDTAVSVEHRLVTEIVFEEGISGIGPLECSDYTNLRKITLPGSAAGNIHFDAFADAYYLEIIEAKADSVSGVGWIYDFSTNTMTLTYSGTGTGAAESDKLWHGLSLVDFNKIMHAKINEGITSLGFNVFWYHLHLESIEIPSTVSVIDQSNFADTPALSEIKVHPDNETYYTIDGVLYGYERDENGEILIEWDKLLGFINEPLASSVIPDTSDVKREYYTQIDDNGKTRVGYIVGKDGRFADSAWVETSQNVLQSGEIQETYSINYQRYSRVLCCVPRNHTDKFTIEPGTIKIGRFAMAGCSVVETVEFPLSLSDIGGSAFADTYALAEFVIPNDSIYKFDKENYILYTVDTEGIIEGVAESRMTIIKALSNISGHYSVPEIYDYVYINDSAFNACTKLTEVTLPFNVQVIGDGAFFNCTSLRTVNMPQNISEVIAHDPESGAEVYLGYASFQNCAITSIDIPEGVARIPDFCFADCVKLKDVDIPDTVEYIEYKAFSCCRALESIVLPDSLSRPHEDNEDTLSMFEGCTSLKHVVLPENKEFDTIGARFFAGCRLLETITIPDTIKTIEEEAFESSGLTSINTNNVELIKAAAFRSCSDLVHAELPSVLSIESEAFLNCRSLKKVLFSENIYHIDETAFENCLSLDENDVSD